MSKIRPEALSFPPAESDSTTTAPLESAYQATSNIKPELAAKDIGGIFPLEAPNPALPAMSFALKAQAQRQFMSGRCALTYLLKHYIKAKTVYLPAYTCETVVAPFLAAGYKVNFYEIDYWLRPKFSSKALAESEVILFCAYFGRRTYLEATLDNQALGDFVEFSKHLAAQGKIIIHDLTHSLFAQEPLCGTWNWAFGSARKWLGIPAGGFAFSQEGELSAPASPINVKHIELRKAALAASRDPQRANELFWEGEYYLREIFSDQEADPYSQEIAAHYSSTKLYEKRCANYKYLYEQCEALSEDLAKAGIRPAHSRLNPGECPSHFTLWVDERNRLKNYLQELKIHSSVYWPVLEQLDFPQDYRSIIINRSLLSLPCDQRYGEAEMQKIVSALKNWTEARLGE